ncbi:MAG: hypothetical protein EAZ57_09985 [Cytophagales bacterium]|nr:MAG: hypothetical protein EAZ67_10485 [Cytophagales bacterium]TAF59772.1 MAG: hypothetical protein EAZ57_09985 [Cytophagales bacterium]
MKYFLLIVLVTAVTLTSFFKAQAQSETSDSLSAMLQLDINTMDLENNNGSLLLQKTSLGSQGDGSVAEAPGVVEVVDRKEILAFGGNTLSDILNRLVNFYMASPTQLFNNQTTLRGDLPDTYSSHVLLMLNGRPFRESLFGSADMAFINTISILDIERIELIRGPGSVLYGLGSFTALINIVMRNEAETKTTITNTLGAYKTRGLNLSQAYNKRNFTLHGSIRYYGQEAEGASFRDVDSVLRTLPQDNQNVGAYISMEGKKFYMRAYYGVTTAYVMNNMLKWPTNPADEFDQTRSKRSFLDMGYKGSFSKTWNYAIRNTINGHSIIFSSFDRRKSKFNSVDNMTDFTNYIKPNRNLNIVWGMSVNLYNHNSLGSLDENGNAINLLSESSSGNLQGFTSILYSQIDYRFFKRLKVLGGAQLVYDASYNRRFFVPRIGAIYLAKSGLGMKLLYGSAIMPKAEFETNFRSPNYRLNSELINERNNNLDVQFFGQFKNVQFGATYYNSHQENVITRRFESKEVYTLYNVDWLKIEGVELECKASIGSRFLLAWNFSYFQTRNSEGERNVTGVPAITTCAGVAYYSKNKAIQTGIYNVFFTKPYDVINGQKGVPPELQRAIVNTVPTSFDLICINFALDITKAFRIKDIPQTVVSVYGENLLGTIVWQPEVFNRRINSIPYQNIGTRAFYLNAAITF